MQQRDDALWEWSVFWQSDQLQSCLPDNSAAGKQSLQGTWRSFFEALPAGAEVLDLGTGNGGLATQAVAVSKARATPFSMHGIDLADIEPARFVSSAEDLLTDVKFHPRTTMEKLPFADATFDAVASQYAIEYTNIEKSSAEALRVLKAGGFFRFLVHADDGVLKDRCRLQTGQAEQILNGDLFAASETLLRRLVDAETTRTAEAIAAAEAAIAATKAVFDDLELRFRGDDDRSLVDKLFAAIRTLPGMRRSHSIESLAAMNENARALLLAQSKRLKSMQDAALDDAAAGEFVKRLQFLGSTNVRLEPATTGSDADCVGYWLSGRKAGDREAVEDE
jgi:ubiquinone/menaquinone biosynthesis C-methylase UbiE